MRHRFAMSIVLAFAFTGLASAASFKVIVNNGVKVESLTKKEIADLFMKKIVHWSNGVAVVPVDQSDRTAVREDFSRAIHGKAAAAVKSYWNQQIFSGRDVPPVEKASDNEVLAFVRSTPGAIGYIASGTSSEGVRVVTQQQ